MTITTLAVLKDSNDTAPGSRVMRKLEQMCSNAGIEMEHVEITHADKAWKAIGSKVPNLVITMGAEAYQEVIGGNDAMGLHRGELLWATKNLLKVKVLPTFHPNYTYQNWSNQETIEYDLRKAWLTSHTPKMPMRMGKNYSVVRSLDELKELRDYIKEEGGYCSFDIETTGFNLFDSDEILCVQLSTKAGEGVVVPLRGAWKRHEEDVYSQFQLDNYFWRFDDDYERVLSKNEKGKPQIVAPAFPSGSIICTTPEAHEAAKVPKGHFCNGTVTDVWGGKQVLYTGPGRMNGKLVPQEYIAAVEMLRWIFEDSPDTQFVAHNGKFDIHGLNYQLGIIPRRFLFDTMLAFHNFHEERPHNLDHARARYTNMPKYDGPLKALLGKGKKNSFATIPNDILWYYGAADADSERRLVEPLIDEIMREYGEDGRWIFDNIDMPFNRTLIQVEDNGMLVDRERFQVLSDTYNDAIRDLHAKLDTYCTDNKYSPLDVYNNANTLRAFLFEKEYELELAPEKRTKCKTCKATPETALDGPTTCPECEGKGTVQKSPRHVLIMQGMNFPSYIVPKSEKTDEQKTDKKAFTALKQWCQEDVLYTKKELKGQLVRTPTQQKLSDRERKRRAKMKEALVLIGLYKQAIQARNLFLEGNPDKKEEGAQAMLKHIRYDGRIHCNYLQLTTTARLSSSNPNLQNIANEDDENGYFYGKGIRTMFTAPDGSVFLEVDYSSQEMRILAYLANEYNLHSVFMVCKTCGEDFSPTEDDPRRPFAFKPHRELTGHEAQDLHTATASLVFKVPYELVTSQQRVFAKRVNFGINYGQGIRGLAEVTGLSMDESRKLIEDYMTAYPGIRIYQARKKTAVYRGKRITNAYGRYRHNYGVNEMRQYLPQYEYEKQLAGMYRQCVNYPVQSSPADIMANVTIALADVWGVEYEDWEAVEAHVIAKDIIGGHPATMLRDMGAKLVNLVHDSTQWEVPKENYDEAANIIETIMVELPFQQLGWFLPVDLKAGPYWGYHEEAA